MGIAYKNFWSLNTDEAVVIGILREGTPKNIEVFMPANAQMKDIDLVIMNMKNKKAVTVQVKGSRAYEPKKSEVEKFGDGSGGWFYFNKKVVHKSSADIFIFLVYVLEENKKAGRRNIHPHIVVIPTRELKILCKKYKRPGMRGMYNFFLWVNPTKKKALEFRDKIYDLSKYLDRKGIEKLNAKLK